MNRTEALRLLRLDGDSDGKAIEQSYWGLVRRAQSRAEDPRAQREIERLNEAYALLSPAGAPQRTSSVGPAPFVSRQPRRAGRRALPSPPAPGLFFPDEALAWFGQEAARVRRRWAGRNLEIALIGGAALVLLIASLLAGASAPLVLVSAAVICAGVWAPWRRSGPGGR